MILSPEKIIRYPEIVVKISILMLVSKEKYPK
jgi:hypothetical protein